MILLATSGCYALAQAIVTDPSSMAQRAAIFLEQMEETVSQSLDIAENADNTRRLFEMTEETVNDMKKVSQFIKDSRQYADITAAEIRIADKLKNYSMKIKESESLSYNEKLNLISSLLNFCNAASTRIKSGIEVVRNGANDAKLSDYERLQILSMLEEEILSLEGAMDETYEKNIGDETRDCIRTTIDNMRMRAITFSF